MALRRLVLVGLALAFGIATVIVATKDVRFGSLNCGTAVLTADPRRGAVLSGDLIDDDFRLASDRAECGQLITRQRFGAVVPLALAIGTLAASRRSPTRRPLRGDPLI